MTNLAAAVEGLNKIMALMAYNNSRDVDITKSWDRDREIENKSAEWIEQHGETILAELGRGAGEPVYQVKHRSKVTWLDSDKDTYDAWTPERRRIVFTRPPVAGLAELRDEQWWDLYVAMDDVTPLGGPFSVTNVAKAAREFFGKGRMSVEVVGTDEKLFKHVSCKRCCSKLRYRQSDTMQRIVSDYGGASKLYTFIICPECSDEVEVKSY